jgi:esterase
MLGHSMGGKVAMQLALTHPQLLTSLIVVDIAPVSYPSQADGHLQVIAGMKALDFDRLHSRAEAEQELAKTIEDEATRKFVLTNLMRDDGGRYSWRLNLAGIEQHYDKFREKPSADDPYLKPTLFVKGALSNYIRAADEAEIRQLFPAAQVKIIMQAGHWLHAEKPQALQKIALDFLTETDSE